MAATPKVVPRAGGAGAGREEPTMRRLRGPPTRRGRPLRAGSRGPVSLPHAHPESRPFGARAATATPGQSWPP